MRTLELNIPYPHFIGSEDAVGLHNKTLLPPPREVMKGLPLLNGEVEFVQFPFLSEWGKVLAVINVEDFSLNYEQGNTFFPRKNRWGWWRPWDQTHTFLRMASLITLGEGRRAQVKTNPVTVPYLRGFNTNPHTKHAWRHVFMRLMSQFWTMSEPEMEMVLQYLYDVFPGYPTWILTSNLGMPFGTGDSGVPLGSPPVEMDDLHYYEGWHRRDVFGLYTHSLMNPYNVVGFNWHRISRRHQETPSFLGWNLDDEPYRAFDSRAGARLTQRLLYGKWDPRSNCWVALAEGSLDDLPRTGKDLGFDAISSVNPNRLLAPHARWDLNQLPHPSRLSAFSAQGLGWADFQGET